MPDEWRCPRCRQTATGGSTHFKIQQAPEVLFIALASGKDNHVQKVDEEGNIHDVNSVQKDFTPVIIPENLDMRPWLNHHQYGPGSDLRYRLAGVVSHSGHSFKAGHYVSFVRGGPTREDWFKVNDERVTRCTLADFDETAADPTDEYAFRTRFTPYIMLYERDHDHDVQMPGFHTINVNEGEEEDKRPTYWTLERQYPPAGEDDEAEDEEDDEEEDEEDDEEDSETRPRFEGALEDAHMPEAEIRMRINIGDIALELPTCFIDHFSMKHKRKIHIDAKIIVPKGTEEELKAIPTADREYVQLDLASAFVDSQLQARDLEEAAEQARRQSKDKTEGSMRTLRSGKTGALDLLDSQALEHALRKARTKKPKPWSKRWKDI